SVSADLSGADVKTGLARWLFLNNGRHVLTLAAWLAALKALALAYIPSMRALELRIPPLAVVIVLALVMWAVARWLPGADFDVPARPFLAVALAVLGAAVTG